MPSSRQAGEVGHSRARDESDFDLSRQAEQIGDPVPAHLLKGSSDRRSDLQDGILIPRRGEDVGSECGGKGATDNETKVPSSSTCDSGRRADRVKLLEDLGGLEWVSWKRP